MTSWREVFWSLVRVVSIQLVAAITLGGWLAAIMLLPFAIATAIPVPCI